MKHRDDIMAGHTDHARMFDAAGNITYGEWHTLCEQYGNVCLACGATGQLSPDHVVPLARGGSNTIDNIQPLCKTCNLSKGAKTVDYRVGRMVNPSAVAPLFIEPPYKSAKVDLSTWQVLARIKATTGESHAQILDRLLRAEEERRSEHSGADRGAAQREGKENNAV